MNTLQGTEASWHSFPTAEGVVIRLGAILRAIRRKREARAAVPHLQSLSDGQLRDIGMERSQIWYLAYGASPFLSRIRHAAD